MKDLLMRSFMMILLRWTCFSVSALIVLSLFLDSGSLNLYSISSIICFSWRISSYDYTPAYLHELSLPSNLLGNGLFDLLPWLPLQEVILLLNALNFDQAFFVESLEGSIFIGEETLPQIVVHSYRLLISNKSANNNKFKISKQHKNQSLEDSLAAILITFLFWEFYRFASWGWGFWLLLFIGTLHIFASSACIPYASSRSGTARKPRCVARGNA